MKICEDGSMIKTWFIVINILAIWLISLTGCSAVNAMPQDLADSTQKIVNEVKAQDNSVFEEIQHNVDMVNRLRTDILTSEETNKQKLLNDVIDELEKVTDSYEELSKKRQKIRKDLLGKISALEKLQKKVRVETTRLTDLRETYSKAMVTLNDPNEEILRTRYLAMEQAIGYIDMQLQLWGEFSATEQQIRSETVVVQQRIDSFLSIIESSAILFREGLNLMKLQRDINDAMSLFTQDLPRMEQLSADMEQSWSHLDALVNTLTSMSIDINNN
ncbi:hypothetical protein ACFLTW_01610 [Chloroflexota bacterium]